MTEQPPIKLAVLGASGRMGREVLKAALADKRFEVKAAAVRSGNPFVGQDIGMLAGLPEQGKIITDNLPEVFDGAHVAIDFTNAAAAINHARLAAKHRTALILGATGLNPDQEAGVLRFAGEVPVIRAETLSLGVTVLTAVVKKLAALLGPEFDIEISDFCHRDKMEAPSGVALALGRAAAEGRDGKLEILAEGMNFGRLAPREEGRIGFSSLRGGDVVGDHTVHFAGPGERLELIHRAGDASVYALGALRGARWAVHASPGIYSMRDVLGIADL
jgi:4-hydroxy-tetrahydrodipicolinate reductase